MCLRIRLSLTLLLVACLCAFYQVYAQGDPAKGKGLFNTNCTACHKLDKKSIGPALGGVADRHDKEWLYKWIQNSANLIKEGDPAAVKIFEEFNKVPMTAFPQLSKEDIDNIVAYTSAVPETPKAAEPAAASTPSVASKQGSSDNTALKLFLIAQSLLILILALIIAAIKLRRKAERENIVIEGPKKSLWKSYLENTFLVLTTCIVLFLIFIYYLYAYLMQIGIDQNYQPVQPIHFSHKIHAGDNQIDCKYCHSNARVSKNSGVPALNVCMNCHKNISEYNGAVNVAEGHDKAFYDGEIQKLYTAAGWDAENAVYTGKTSPVKWVRIHNLPDFVYFNHSQHVSVAGIECQKCHGKVEEMEEVRQFAPLTMGWCIDCHRQTDVKIKDNPYYQNIHKQLAEKYGVEKITEAQMGGTECGKCHY